MLHATERSAWTNHRTRPQAAVKELFSRMLFVVARPLEAYGTIEARVTHPRMHRTELTNFVPHLFRGGMAKTAVHADQYFTIAAHDFGSSDAPPTRAPSISFSDISDLALSGFTEPP